MRHDLIDSVVGFSKKNLLVALDEHYYVYDLKRDRISEQVKHGVRITVLKQSLYEDHLLFLADQRGSLRVKDQEKGKDILVKQH